MYSTLSVIKHIIYNESVALSTLSSQCATYVTVANYFAELKSVETSLKFVYRTVLGKRTLIRI